MTAGPISWSATATSTRKWGENDVESGYREPSALQEFGNGKFADVSMDAGPGILEKVRAAAARSAISDNDGDIDVLVNCVNDVPHCSGCDSSLGNNWLKVKTWE